MKTLLASVMALAFGIALSAADVPQTAGRSAAAEKPAPAPLTLTGCVSPKPGSSGQYTFAEADGLSKYRLSGKDIKKFAGQRVELVAGSSGKGLSIRGGLWPSPNVAARGGDIDPAQESIARQPGGGGSPAGTEMPEIRVTRLKIVDGACQ